MFTRHIFAAGLLSQPEFQVNEVAGAVGDAVRVTGVPALKINPQVCEQAIPPGVLTTVPVPTMVTTRLGPVGPVPVKQTTLAVMKPVWIPPLPEFIVADTSVLPQEPPVAVIKPV